MFEKKRKSIATTFAISKKIVEKTQFRKNQIENSIKSIDDDNDDDDENDELNASTSIEEFNETTTIRALTNRSKTLSDELNDQSENQLDRASSSSENIDYDALLQQQRKIEAKITVKRKYQLSLVRTQKTKELIKNDELRILTSEIFFKRRSRVNSDNENIDDVNDRSTIKRQRFVLKSKNLKKYKEKNIREFQI